MTGYFLFWISSKREDIKDFLVITGRQGAAPYEVIYILTETDNPGRGWRPAACGIAARNIHKTTNTKNFVVA